MTGTPGCPVLDRVLEVAARAPDRTAVVGAERDLTYRQLAAQTAEYAGRLSSLGLRSRSVVALSCDGEEDVAAAWLGARAAGHVPALVDARLEGSGLVTIGNTARPAAWVHLRHGLVREGEVDAPGMPPGAGYVSFSSGSQGTPKAIVGSATGLASFLRWEAHSLSLGAQSRVAMLTSPSFDVVLRDLLVALCSGGQVHVAPSVVRFSPGRVLRWVADHRITVLHAVPSLAMRWLAARPVALPELAFTLFAGEPLSGTQVRSWREVAPNTRILNLYGPSETTLAAFAYQVPDLVGDGVLPVGRPLPGVSVQLEPVPTQAVPGPEAHGPRRVVISNAHGSLGYLPGTAHPDQVAQLQRTGDVTVFRTSDRGEVDEHGNLVVAGRLDSLVKRHGTFVDTALIESAAVGDDAVTMAVCLQEPDTGDIALLVQAEPETDGHALLARLRPKLGPAVPDRVLTLDAVPRLPSGKADRVRLRELLAVGALDESGWSRGHHRPTAVQEPA